MSDDRTDGQKAADTALTEAVTVAVGSRTEEGQEGTVTDWLLLVATQRWDDDGDATTTVTRLVDADAPPPAHRQLGLLEFERARLIRYICDDSEDE